MIQDITTYQLIVIFFSLILIIRSFIKVLNHKKTVREAIVTSLIWLGFGTIALFPHVLNLIGKALGFELASNAVFTIAIIVIILVLFNISKQTEKNNSNLTKLVRKLALTELTKK